ITYPSLHGHIMPVAASRRNAPTGGCEAVTDRATVSIFRSPASRPAADKALIAVVRPGLVNVGRGATRGTDPASSATSRRANGSCQRPRRSRLVRRLGGTAAAGLAGLHQRQAGAPRRSPLGRRLTWSIDRPFVTQHGVAVQVPEPVALVQG